MIYPHLQLATCSIFISYFLEVILTPQVQPWFSGRLPKNSDGYLQKTDARFLIIISTFWVHSDWVYLICHLVFDILNYLIINSAYRKMTFLTKSIDPINGSLNIFRGSLTQSHPKSFMMHLKSWKRHLKSLTRNLKSFARHLKSFVRHLRSLKRHLKSSTIHLKSFTRHLNSLTRHLNSSTRHLNSFTRHLNLVSAREGENMNSDHTTRSANIPEAITITSHSDN